ncbi:hypothetical protein SDC9_168452 [bioreactor metagenome]|uniref:Uncharacterized protein n=1 Tax=bioreactor metagenome TaxID=1076179 RepID=A0A645GB10_9ZZZZ
MLTNPLIYKIITFTFLSSEYTDNAHEKNISTILKAISNSTSNILILKNSFILSFIDIPSC